MASLSTWLGSPHSKVLDSKGQQTKRWGEMGGRRMRREQERVLEREGASEREERNREGDKPGSGIEH